MEKKYFDIIFNTSMVFLETRSSVLNTLKLTSLKEIVKMMEKKITIIHRN